MQLFAPRLLALAFCTLLGSGHAAAAKLQEIRGTTAERDCLKNGCEYKEWALGGAASVRFAIVHWEDGGPSYFCKPMAKSCKPFLVVIPVVKAANGKLDYAYPRSITGMSFGAASGSVKVWATFDHEVGNVDYDCRLLSQQRLPVVLFEGVADAHGHLRPYRFEFVSLASLLKQAKVSTAKARKLGWGCPPQSR